MLKLLSGFILGIFIVTLMGAYHIAKIEKKIAAICQGQCTFGDPDCVKRCSERGICPTTGAKAQ